jgi:methyl-accepting chemotaxis protein
MKKANQILTIFYSIALFISTGIYSGLLSETNLIEIHNSLFNILLIIGSTALISLIFFSFNPLFLRDVKELLNGKYNSVSNEAINTLVKYPLKIIPLIIITYTINLIIYPLAGTITGVIEIKNGLLTLTGFFLISLFLIMITTILQVYSSKITTNFYISRAIRQSNIIEAKGIFIPLKYKIIGVFTIISIGAFIVIAYSVFNNAFRYLEQNLYNNTTTSASLIADALNSNTNADNILKEFSSKFKNEYRFYLYNPKSKEVINYSNAPLSDKRLKDLDTRNFVKDKQNNQTLVQFDKPVNLNGNTFFLVIGIKNNVYRDIIRRFISTMLLSGIFILFIVLITTFLVSKEIVSHAEKLLHYSANLSDKKLNILPALVSTDEIGIASLNLRKLVKLFKESKINMDDNIATMNEMVSSTINNISTIKSIITEQANHTDNLFSTTNSIGEISKQITDISIPFKAMVDKNSENLLLAIQKNKEIKLSINSYLTHTGRIIKLIEKDAKVYEDIKYNVIKLKNILLSTNTTYNSIKTDVSNINVSLKEFRDSINNITNLSNNTSELTKDIEIMLNEAQTITENTLNFLSTFLSHIQQADEMLGIINNVAERTNLLSVNAFILAASPQTEGKNFRVVAEEIKKLAGRARTGSADIANYIIKIRRNVDEIATEIQGIRSITSTLKQSVSGVIASTQRTGRLLTLIDELILNLINEDEKLISDKSLLPNSSNDSLIALIDTLLEKLSTTAENITNVIDIFNNVRNQLLNLNELFGLHDNSLTPLNNAVDDIKTFVGYINDSLSIDVKEQLTLSSNSTRALINQIKENEQKIIELDNTILQLMQELDLLKENINLFIV